MTQSSSPGKVREELGIEPGQHIEAFAGGRRIEPVPAELMKGFVSEVENDFAGERDRDV